MKVAFLRGAFLNPWELQSVSPLAGAHEVTAIGADWQFYKHPFSPPGVLMKKNPLWGGALSGLSPSLPARWNWLASRVAGASYGLRGLDAALAGKDIVHAEELYLSITHQCMALKAKHRWRLVATVWENLKGMGERHPRRRRWKKRAVQEIDAFAAVTPMSRDVLIQEGVKPEKIAVIPMGIHLEAFRPAAKDPALMSSLGLRPDDVVVLFSGRFVPEKGVLDLLRAAPEAARRASARRLVFLFMGDGPLRGEIEKAAAQAAPAVLRRAFVPYERTPAFHNLADIFVLPSKRGPTWEEQFGYVLVESMACGKAVITTRSGAIPQVVGDAARLVPPGDPRALAEAVAFLAGSRDARQALERKARARASAFFDAERTAAAFEIFYERALAGRPVGDLNFYEQDGVPQKENA